MSLANPLKFSSLASNSALNQCKVEVRTHVGTPQFFLGGPARLSAYGTNELFGNRYHYARVGYLHRLLTLPPFRGRQVYAIGVYEFGKMYNARNSSKFPNDGAVGLLAQTAVGPLFIGASVGDTGHAKWFLALGMCSNQGAPRGARLPQRATEYRLALTKPEGADLTPGNSPAHWQLSRLLQAELEQCLTGDR